MDFSQVESKIAGFFADGEVVSRSSGQVFTDFEKQPDIMMITKGYIKLVTYTSTRQERIQYIAGPGEGIPMHNLFVEMPSALYPLYAVAFSEVTYLSKRRQDFLQFVDTNPTVVVAILQGIMQGVFDRLYNFNLETAEQKVAHILILYAKLKPSQLIETDALMKLDLPMTVHVVASSVYISKDKTAEIFKAFEAKGYLTFNGPDVHISIEKLQDVAGLKRSVALSVAS